MGHVLRVGVCGGRSGRGGAGSRGAVRGGAKDGGDGGRRAVTREGAQGASKERPHSPRPAGATCAPREPPHAAATHVGAAGSQRATAAASVVLRVIRRSRVCRGGGAGRGGGRGAQCPAPQPLCSPLPPASPCRSPSQPPSLTDAVLDQRGRCKDELADGGGPLLRPVRRGQVGAGDVLQGLAGLCGGGREGGKGGRGEASVTGCVGLGCVEAGGGRWAGGTDGTISGGRL